MNDLISRQAAIEHIKKRLYETALNNETGYPYYEEMADNRVSVWLDEVPTIDPAERGVKVCPLYSDDEVTEYCVEGPCTDQMEGRCPIAERS